MHFSKKNQKENEIQFERLFKGSKTIKDNSNEVKSEPKLKKNQFLQF